MKPPTFVVAPLELRPGVPSPALLRAVEVWPATQRLEQLAAIVRSANDALARFVVLASEDRSVDQVDGEQLPTAAVLVECLPGRSAVVMLPQVVSPLGEGDTEQLAVSLLAALNENLREQGLLLVQALTKNRQDRVTRLFEAAGYRCVGDLLYLGADLSRNTLVRVPGLPIQPVELISHSPDDFDRWIPLIDRTYEKTLDCPAVDGMRPTRDVLIGYRDIGSPRDDWWFVVRQAGRDVGCLILADHRPAAHAELVYMGLAPEVRGQGWGVYLAQQAREIAAAAGAQQMVLSVDAANLPALRHYQAAGFQFWEQRTILIKSLSS